MSSPDFAITPTSFEALDPVSFGNGSGTILRPVVDGANYPANPASTPSYYGGLTVLELTATSTDAVARSLQFYEGRVATTQGAGTTGALSTTAGTIVRAIGSFIADGWKVGHGVILLSPTAGPDDAQAGIFCVVTGVVANTLTLNGAPLSVNAGLVAGTRVVRARPLGLVGLAGQQGTVSNQPAPVDVIGALAGGLTVKTERKMGVNDLILAGVTVAPTAGTVVTVGGSLARY